jgi:hypothetical protein
MLATTELHGLSCRCLAFAPLLLLRAGHRLQLSFRAHHRQAADRDTAAAARQHLEHPAVFSEADNGHGGIDGKRHDARVAPSAAGSNLRLEHACPKEPDPPGRDPAG